MELEAVELDHYQSLHDAVEAYKLPNVDPKWIPEAYSISEVTVAEFDERTDILAIYSGTGDSEIIVRILVLKQTPNVGYEQNDKAGKNIYTINNTEFQISKNIVQNRATWVIGNCYCSISGTLSEDELKEMINSIFEE